MIPCFPVVTASPKRAVGIDATGLHVPRSEEHTSELQSPCNLVCRLLLEKKKRDIQRRPACTVMSPRDTHQHISRASDPIGGRARLPLQPQAKLSVMCCMTQSTKSVATLS